MVGALDGGVGGEGVWCNLDEWRGRHFLSPFFVENCVNLMTDSLFIPPPPLAGDPMQNIHPCQRLECTESFVIILFFLNLVYQKYLSFFYVIFDWSFKLLFKI